MARNPLSYGCGQPPGAQARRQSFQLLTAIFLDGSLHDDGRRMALESACRRWPLMAEVDEILADQPSAKQVDSVPAGIVS
ncbi:hypothetical protein ABS755_14250 [Castellaniella sp. FW104-16D08]|uniref:hypothetical protein n=1 Tax=unclassified Castellaniella TaxID=2617606 RepID=UPI003314FEBC